MPTWKKVLLEGDDVAAESVQGGEFPDAGYSFPGAVAVDTVNEYTANTGVTVDGLLLKDGNANFTWTDWTPTLTQGSSVACSINEAKYCIIGKVCHIYAKLTVTGTGTNGQLIKIAGVPTAVQPAVTGRTPAGAAYYMDNGAFERPAILIPNGANDFWLMDTATTAWAGTNPGFALANGDTINFTAMYRIA